MTEPVFKVALRGEPLLDHPRWNKGTAFTKEERVELNLVGRLPFQVDSLDQQCQRAYNQLNQRSSDILKNTFLQSLKTQNWVLYYSLLSRHLRELIPIIYTPTEAEAISNYSTLFRRSEGLYLSFPHQDRMEEDFLAQTKGRDLQLIVVSDAEAILGIGDQGVGGIGISTAKAAIYTLIGGIDPSRSLPVVLDVGTNNEELRNDDLYVGWPQARVRGEEYNKFVDKFVQLVRKYLPHSLLHFEDFGVSNAQRLLDTYRDKHAVFNDDVQGTGAVTLATLMSAIGLTKNKKLSSHKIVIYGAGSAGLGIARQIRDGMIHLDGVSQEEANIKFWLIDKDGLVCETLLGVMQDQGKARPGWEEFARKEQDWKSDSVAQGKGHDLKTVVEKVKPTVLIGTSTQGGAFTEEVIKAMTEHTDRPIILPLSNPSKLVEVKPEDAMKWSQGKALIATGSPFKPVDLGEGKGSCEIAECNNALIYPGLGFGAILAQSRTLTDSMLIAGTQALASLSPALKNKSAADPSSSETIPPLLPDFAHAPDVNFEVAVAVATQAIEEGSAGVTWGKDEVRKRAEEMRWRAVYGRYVYDKEGGSV